jgi:signal transduction histidine kinase
MRLGTLAARYHRAFNDRDFDVWREVFDEDVELFVDGKSFRGVDAAVAYGVGSVSQFPGLYIASERILAESGDTIVTEIQLMNGDPASGQSRRQGTACEISQVRHGHIVSVRSYYMAEPAGGPEAVVVLSRAGAALVAEEQAALRRVATLVATGVSQEELFAAVTEEMGWLVTADATSLLRFEPDDTVRLVAAWSARHTDLPIGSSRPMNERLRSMQETGRALRWGPTHLPHRGPFVAEARARGIRTVVGVPIAVEGRVWGAAFVCSTADQPFADDVEPRVSNFTQLVATAISNAQARDDARRLADEQAALRRVAMLVASESSPDEIFAAVAAEVGQLFDLQDTRMIRYEGDGTATVVASWGKLAQAFPVGSRVRVEGKAAKGLLSPTERAIRIDDLTNIRGELAARARELGVRSVVGAPIVVDGKLWGTMFTASLDPDPIPGDTEARIGKFAELVATAISNVKARSELAASRARIVAAADEERQRVVRDLHDGAQQRLVQTLLTLKLAREALERDPESVPALVNEAIDQAQQATTELRELSRGILPRVLMQGGLRAGVEVLASRMPVPVDVDVRVGRLPTLIEATAYFVVAEALTNVVKHAHARSVAVSARVEDHMLCVAVRDDGVGGAEREDRSGLLGLRDRLSVLHGHLRVQSPAERGTVVAADIPLGDP